MPLQTEVRTDFSGGLNAAAAPYAAAKNQVLRVSNMLLDESGALRVRDGILSIDAGLVGVTDIRLLIAYTKSGFSVEQLAVANTGNTVMKLYRRGTPWTLIGTFTNGFFPPITWVQYAGIIVFASGWGESPRWYNGTSFGQISATVGQTVPDHPPHPTPHQHHNPPHTT